MRGNLDRKQSYLGQALTEEWRLAPGSLELAWFAEEVDAAARELAALETRLKQLEGK